MHRYRYHRGHIGFFRSGHARAGKMKYIPHICNLRIASVRNHNKYSLNPSCVVSCPLPLPSGGVHSVVDQRDNMLGLTRRAFLSDSDLGRKPPKTIARRIKPIDNLQRYSAVLQVGHDASLMILYIVTPLFCSAGGAQQDVPVAEGVVTSAARACLPVWHALIIFQMCTTVDTQ